MLARPTPLWWKVCNITLMVAYTVVGILGAVGALYYIANHITTYKVSFG